MFFDVNVIGYLFLAGAGGGAWALTCIAGLAGLAPTRHSVWRGGLFLPTPIVLLGALLLLCDLGVPARALSLWSGPGFTWIGLGSWAILLFCLFQLAGAGLYGYLKRSGMEPMAEYPSEQAPGAARILMRVLLVAGLALATLLIGYTGMLVSTLNALPFLNNWLVVALFVVSALSSGGGLLMLWAFFNQGARISHWQFRRLHHIGVALILLELLLVAALLLFAYTQGGLTWESAQQLLDGRLRYWFGFGLVLVGLLLPLFFHVVPWQKNRIARWTFAETCALVGSFCLRYCLLTAALSSAVLL